MTARCAVTARITATRRCRNACEYYVVSTAVPLDTLACFQHCVPYNHCDEPFFSPLANDSNCQRFLSLEFVIFRDMRWSDYELANA